MSKCLGLLTFFSIVHDNTLRTHLIKCNKHYLIKCNKHYNVIVIFIIYLFFLFLFFVFCFFFFEELPTV